MTATLTDQDELSRLRGNLAADGFLIKAFITLLSRHLDNGNEVFNTLFDILQEIDEDELNAEYIAGYKAAIQKYREFIR